MFKPLLIAACGLLSMAAQAQDWSGQLRARVEDRSANSQGPVAAANALLPGFAAVPADVAAIDVELRGQWRWLNAAVALHQETSHNRAGRSSAVVNELYASGGLGLWQFSAGRKLVSWDVGYAFRPNDVVAQEERRTLLSSQVQGRPLLSAEYFDADTAWSLVWVNPNHGDHERMSDEQALAGRVYKRIGGLDAHGFARWGEHTGASIGSALAWVATESLELHGSVRYARRADALLAGNSINGLARSAPWTAGMRNHVTQALVGLSWTGESRLSLLAEAWFDGNAASSQDWRNWNARGAQLLGLVGKAPDPALAGNLAWQAQGFGGGGSNLQQRNLFLRLSWDYEGWTPALDCLYHPADGGHVLTASVGWQGDRIRLDAGLRRYGGPSASVLAQLPQRGQAFAAATWAF
nr:hypothetical protein [uncultured Roseateles sp.]